MVGKFCPEEGLKEENVWLLVMNISKTLNITTLSNKDEIQIIFKKGQKIYNKFGLLFLYSNKRKLRKVGILIKKQSGNAIQRNYIKRIIKQFVRNQYSAFCAYEKIIFLYNYKGKISYKELNDTYLKSIENYERNITSIN